MHVTISYEQIYVGNTKAPKQTYHFKAILGGGLSEQISDKK